jgi:hypothetical protein
MKKYWLCSAVVVVAVSAAALAIADSASAPPAGQPQLPAGWTMEDMQAMTQAGTPGEMHKKLADGAGTWKAKTQMWMAPGAPPMESEGQSKVTPLMDGRFVQVEMSGEMPGMGPYNGLGIYGFDNVGQKFVAIWLDNHGTGIMKGEGELSDDGKVITWEFTGNCPITKGPVKMREVETITGPNSKTIETFGIPPKATEEMKIMRIELTRE